MEDNGPGRQAQLHGPGPQPYLKEGQIKRDVRSHPGAVEGGGGRWRLVKVSRGFAPQPPPVHREGRDQDTHRRGGEAVPILDQRREIERWEQLAVAEWPVLAAAQSGSGDPDNGAEDDEQVGESRRGPGEWREASRHGRGNVRAGREPCSRVARRGVSRVT